MEFLFHLSGEHPEFPVAEIEGVLAGEEAEYKVVGRVRDKRLLFVEAAVDDSAFIGRLAYTKEAGQVLAPLDDFARIRESVSALFQKGSGFRVRCKSHSIEEELGALIHKEGYNVDLDEPDFEVGCYEGTVFLSIPTAEELGKRRPQFRPFFMPMSLHTKLARGMVNLAAVKRGDVLMDPFCGTGGILIEAGLMGLQLAGYDLDSRMVRGTQENLNHFELPGRILRGDALSLDEKVDAVVTDPPYGRSSPVGGRKPADLIMQFANKAGDYLNPGGRLVFAAPSETEFKLPDFEVLGTYDLRVHKSLTRRITVAEKLI
ncbi:tRNA (guanine(10)-N2)-dimethyltransferase [uncultured archaeon]|nr:tRNA (guanine(10)-N2)-dimethyltransferase [uncultured archaeon]